jgi:hypothetical protein
MFATKNHETIKVAKFPAPVVVVAVVDFKPVRASAYLASLAHLCELRFSYLLPIVSLQERFVRHGLQD